MSNNCINKYTFWEDKAILLGIILFLTKYSSKITYKTIFINNKKIKKILKVLFPKMIFTSNENNNLFYINIKNSNRHNLVINNIDNLIDSNIKTKKIYKLPWYNKDNPIVMYYYNKKYDNYNLNKFKLKLDKFTKYNRLLNYKTNNNIICKCSKINTWDCYYEHKILNKYCKKFGNNVNNIYNFISSHLMNNIFSLNQINYINNQLKNNLIIKNSQLNNMYNNLVNYSIKYKALEKMYNNKNQKLSDETKKEIQLVKEDKKNIEKKLTNIKEINDFYKNQINNINKLINSFNYNLNL